MLKDVTFTEKFSQKDLDFIASYKYKEFSVNEYFVKKDILVNSSLLANTSVDPELLDKSIKIITESINEAIAALKLLI